MILAPKSSSQPAGISKKLSDSISNMGEEICQLRYDLDQSHADWSAIFDRVDTLEASWKDLSEKFEEMDEDYNTLKETVSKIARTVERLATGQLSRQVHPSRSRAPRTNVDEAGRQGGDGDGRDESAESAPEGDEAVADVHGEIQSQKGRKKRYR